MLNITNLSGFGGTAGTSPIITFQDAYYVTSARTSPVTAASLDCGTGDNRLVVVCLCYDNGGGTAVSSLTIGGVSATAVFATTSGPIKGVFYALGVPDGANDVVFTYSGGVLCNLIGLAVYTVNDFYPAISSTWSKSASPDWSLSLAHPAGSAVFGVLYNTTADTTPVTITGTDMITDAVHSYGSGFYSVFCHRTTPNSSGSSISGSEASYLALGAIL